MISKIFGSLLLSVACVQVAVAESFSSEALFRAAAPALLTENFDSLPAGTEISFLPCLGVQFENPGDGFPEIVAGSGSVPSSAPNSLANRPINVFSTQPIRFSRIDAALITAAGFYNPTSDDQLRLSMLDDTGQVIESLIVEPQPAPTFGGIVLPLGAATVEIAWTGNAGNGLHGADDLLLAIGEVATPDADGDGVDDTIDNCALVPNHAQIDTDGDNFGNACDADLNNDCTVSFSDLGEMKAVFFQTGNFAADLTGDGAVNFADLAVLKAGFFETPGPSCPASCAP